MKENRVCFITLLILNIPLHQARKRARKMLPVQYSAKVAAFRDLRWDREVSVPFLRENPSGLVSNLLTC